MIFKGHQKSSFIDYPDRISTVFFTGGCNFRCPYCHNCSLVSNIGVDITADQALEYLKKRKKFIDALCISGGEPTIHNELYDFIDKAKKLGFVVKLDTNGTRPDVIKKLLGAGLLDYIAMDIKAPLHKYGHITQSEVNIEEVKQSINIIRNSNIDYEFRTTVCKELSTKEDITEIAEYLRGSKRYSIQNFKDNDSVLIGKGELSSYDLKTLEDIGKNIEAYFEILNIR